MKHLRRLIYVVPTAIALGWLTRDVRLAAQVLAMVLLVWLPLAGIVAAIARGRLNVGVAFAIAWVLIAGLYYVRRAIPLPAMYADCIIVALLVGLSMSVGGYRRALRRWPSVPALIVLPLLLLIISEPATRLAVVAVVVKTSPDWPLSVVVGDEPISRGWCVLAPAAWTSELFGRDSSVVRALAAMMLSLIATICAALRGRILAAVVAIVLVGLLFRWPTSRDRDYVEIGAIARLATPASAIVIDLHDAMQAAVATERRVWLPDDRQSRRRVEFGMMERQTSKYLAAAADALIVEGGELEPDKPWKLYARRGKYALYLSTLSTR